MRVEKEDADLDFDVKMFESEDNTMSSSSSSFSLACFNRLQYFRLNVSRFENVEFDAAASRCRSCVTGAMAVWID